MYILFAFTLIIGISSIFLFSGFSSSSNKLKIGDKAPLFELYDQNGNLISLQDYKEKKIVIYFFPKAFTPGWTKQACGFRNQYDAYKKNNIEIIGISYDTRDTQKSFSDKYSLNFVMLSDSEKKVAQLYGVDTYFFPKRVTFLIDEKGIVFDVIKNIGLDNYAETIIEIFKKNNVDSTHNVNK